MTSDELNLQLQLSDYQLLYDKLYALALETQKSLVTVTGMQSEVDWFNNTYESKNQTSGVLIANNDKDIFILANQNAFLNADKILITFDPVYWRS